MKKSSKNKVKETSKTHYFEHEFCEFYEYISQNKPISFASKKRNTEDAQNNSPARRRERENADAVIVLPYFIVT